MKKSILKYLTCSLLSLLAFNSFAEEKFAPISSETWECTSSNKARSDFKIVVNNVEQTSSGSFNGVELNNEAQLDHYILTGFHLGDVQKYYSIKLLPGKKVNYFRGAPQLVMDGKAILYFEEYTDFAGEVRGEALYQCRVQLDR